MIVVTAYASSRRDEVFWVFLGWAVLGVCLPVVSLVSGCLVRWLVGRKLTGVYFSWLLLTSGGLGNVVLGLLHVLGSTMVHLQNRVKISTYIPRHINLSA